MVGWHHQLDGHEFEQAPGVGDGQGNLACYSPWGCKESDTTEQLNNGKESNTYIHIFIYMLVCVNHFGLYKDKTTLEISYMLICFSHV